MGRFCSSRLPGIESYRISLVSSSITFQHHPTDGEEILHTIQPAIVGSWISIQVDRHAIVVPESAIVIIGTIRWMKIIVVVRGSEFHSILIPHDITGIPGNPDQVDGVLSRFWVQDEPGIFSWKPLPRGCKHFNTETCRRWFRQLIHLLQTQPKVAVEWSKPRLEHGPCQIETREVDPLLHDNPVVDRRDRSGLWKGWNRQVDRLVCDRITCDQ